MLYIVQIRRTGSITKDKPLRNSDSHGESSYFDFVRFQRYSRLSGCVRALEPSRHLIQIIDRQLGRLSFGGITSDLGDLAHFLVLLF